jgi:hypothetical protein
MNGKWVGFTSGSTVRSGDWLFTRVSSDVSRVAQRNYDLKV